MGLKNDLRNYLIQMQGLAQLHADLAKEDLSPVVRWKALANRTARLRLRLEQSIRRSSK